MSSRIVLNLSSSRFNIALHFLMKSLHRGAVVIERLAVGEVARESSLLSGVDAKGVVVLDLDPGADVGAPVARKRDHPLSRV